MSKGSVIPTFLSQIKSGGPVTIYRSRHDTILYDDFATVSLVLQCGMQATHGKRSY